MKSRRIRYLDRIGLALVLAAAVGGLLWTARNTIVHQRLGEKEKKVLAGERSRLVLAEQNLASLRTARTRLQEDAQTLSRRIPARLEMGALVKKLHARMKERRLTLSALHPQAPVSEALYTQIPIRLVFQGSFAQIYRFFHDVETMEQLLVPERVVISASESDGGKCQVEVTLLAFERKAPKSGG